MRVYEGRARSGGRARRESARAIVVYIQYVYLRQGLREGQHLTAHSANEEKDVKEGEEAEGVA
jgi:hypothetical protein